MITANIIKDSISGAGARITTLQLEYPRFIHSEFMTHRVFSRNASSSRAEPIDKKIERIVKNTAYPEEWGINKPGTSPETYLSESDKQEAIKLWNYARDDAIAWARKLQELNIHKQLVNRVVEPYSHISVICTATEWDNFFSLRIDPSAQAEICVLASKIFSALKNSNPTYIEYGNWHLPYVTEAEEFMYHNRIDILLQVSTARCARVSYMKHDGSNPNIDEDIVLYKRLVGQRPRHASPCEHQASPLKDKNDWSRNFKGWLQHRELVENYTD